MEIVVLNALDFQLGRPLPLHFLRRTSKAAHADSRMHTLAKYLMELTIVDEKFSPWAPSLLAATSSYVTLNLLSKDSEDESKWTPTLAFYSGYNESQLKRHAGYMCHVIIKSKTSRHYLNIRKKYAANKHERISECRELESPFVAEMANRFPLEN